MRETTKKIFLDNFDEIYTENGARAKSTTKNYLVDLLGHGAAMRDRAENDCISLFSKALATDADKAMKLLFYIRDIREGQGERRFFRICMKFLTLEYPKTVIQNLELIPEFGRWDDVIELIGINAKVDEVIKSLLRKQIANDLRVEYPSLLGKWLPSERAGKDSYEKFVKVVKLLYGEFNYSNARLFRKNVTSPLRDQIKIIEHNIVNKSYTGIDYSKVPSLAMKRYYAMFLKYDEENFTKYLESLSKGKVKVNAATLTPYDIVERIMNDRNIDSNKTILFDEQWKALKDIRNKNAKENIVVCDVSGSMYPKYINVAIGLAIYLAERNEGIFKNKFITFSEKPKIQDVVGKNIVSKVRNLCDADWGMNTDIEAVFDRVLRIAIDNEIAPADMIQNVYVISDMEFDAAQGYYGAHKKNDTLFETIRAKFKRHGYTMPHLIFWNVENRTDQFPCDVTENATFISGFSPNHVKFAFDGAESVVEQICSDKRYEKIKF